MKFGHALALTIIVIFLAVAGLCATGRFPGQRAMGVLATHGQLAKIDFALREFQSRYNALPGDLPNAGKLLHGCTGIDGSDCNPWPKTAGDGIIGRTDFAKTWLPQVGDRTHVPATSAADETVLFWSHLQLAGLLDKETVPLIENGMSLKWGVTNPLSRFGNSGFIVGYSDGTPLPSTLAPHNTGMKGIVLVLTSTAVLEGKAEMNTAGKQPLTPLQAAISDRHMDDGWPDTGFIQAYGAPDCFKRGAVSQYHQSGYEYNETLDEGLCGLIFKMTSFENEKPKLKTKENQKDTQKSRSK